MSTPATAIAGGFFAQLMPMLADRTVMMIVSKADEHHLTVSVIPKRLKDSENAALATPFCCTGTPEELDRELPTQVREFVAGYVALGANLAEIQREREEAEKAAREELKKNGLLRLPWGRDHIVLAGPLLAVDQLANDRAANPGSSRARFKAVARAPGSRDEAPESASDSMEAWERRDAPNLIWAADHTWLVASEVDFDSTLVGGSTELIEAIIESPELEAWQVEPTDSLAADADKINSP